MKMGPRAVECLIYQCVNEETGCNYEIERRVPVQMYTGPRGIKQKKRSSLSPRAKDRTDH